MPFSSTFGVLSSRGTGQFFAGKASVSGGTKTNPSPTTVRLTFTSSGSMTIDGAISVTADVLVVGGGNTGTSAYLSSDGKTSIGVSGGGGSGGVVSFTPASSIAPGSYTITVGGASAQSSIANGPTVLYSASGGSSNPLGAAGANGINAAADGGHGAVPGGSGGGTRTTGGVGGAGTPTPFGTFGGGGGGGSQWSRPPTGPTGSVSGASGGAGGGGAGGPAGYPGAGNGVDGSENTGGGGGGGGLRYPSGSYGSGGSGGSGIVIVQFPSDLVE